MSTYIPRSRRLGLHPENDGPFEGIPEHLEPQLRNWVEFMLGQIVVERVQELALQLHVAVGDYDPAGNLVEAVTGDDDKMWDLFEAILQEGDIHNVFEEKTYGAEVNRADIRRMLDLAGSVYTVSDDGLIVERVIDEAAETYSRAVSVEDAISDHLRQAWRYAYGLKPNPSRAWDHAIKAVEAMLYPVVSPNHTKATLGSMLNELKPAEKPGEEPAESKYRGVYLGPGRDHSVGKLVEMLRLIWPNPDRHGSGVVQKPKLTEARAVVTLTAALVQTHRDAKGLVYLASQDSAAS